MVYLEGSTQTDSNFSNIFDESLADTSNLTTIGGQQQVDLVLEQIQMIKPSI